jgi:hypothetical protein
LDILPVDRFGLFSQEINFDAKVWPLCKYFTQILNLFVKLSFKRTVIISGLFVIDDIGDFLNDVLLKSDEQKFLLRTNLLIFRCFDDELKFFPDFFVLVLCTLFYAFSFFQFILERRIFQVDEFMCFIDPKRNLFKQLIQIINLLTIIMES